MHSDFLIIGAGVIGLSSALKLLQHGASVTVLDRGACGSESSWAGGGILSPLCPWDYAEEVTRLTSLGAAMFPAWARSLHEATGIDPEYEASGMLVLPPFDAQAARLWCGGHQVTMELLPSNPDQRGVEWEGEALFLPDVAQVRNPRLMHALRKQVELLGGRIIEHCAVQDIEADSARVRSLRTRCGEMKADQYIVASGAWSQQVLGRHGMQIDIKPIRGQILQFKFPAPPLPHIVLQRDLYLIPRRDGCLLVGSTLEDVGFDKSVTQTACDDLRARAGMLLPQLRNMPPVQHWAGLRPASPRNIPAIGRHPGLDNLYLNCGHFRYGVTMAWASAHILLNEITGEPQPFDAAPYQTWWNAA
ncbi:MAG: glycine oxidase ThiO [Gallionellaceae bacterium]